MKPRGLFQYYRALTMLALLVFASSALFGQGTGDVPNAPKEIFANWMPSSDAKLIQIMWINDLHIEDMENVNVKGYNLYQSVNSGAFSKVNNPDIDGTPWGGQASVTAEETGLYKFYVTAYNDAGESDKSPEVSVKVTSVIYFEENVVFDKGKTGEEYSHTFTAKGENGAVITYALAEANGATIDATTGAFSFTPTKDGAYEFQIIARLADDDDAFAMAFLYLYVGEGSGGCPPKEEPCAVIKGIVRDNDGNVIEKGIIILVPAGEDGDKPWGDGDNPWGDHGDLDSAMRAHLDSLMREHGLDTNDGDKPWGDGDNPWGDGDKPWGDGGFPWDGPIGGHGAFEGTIENGAYEVAVPKGSYYIMIGCELVTIATVDCGDTLTVDIVLSENNMPEPPTVTTITISGRVTRAADGSGIKAMLMFYSTDDAFMPLMVNETDDDGNYSIELLGAYGSQQFSYVAQAIPYEGDLYYQYFDGVDNIAAATAIATSRDDVNFSLGAMPVYNNSISGTVKDGEGKAVAATVFAFPTEMNVVPGGAMMNMVETQNGVYTLQHLRPGTYVVGVVPHKGNLAPGYYAGADKEVEIDWEKAVVVTMSENTTLAGANMILQTVDADGINVVDGIIRQQTGKISGKGDNVLGTTPLAGAMVYALDKNGSIVGSAVSRRDGKYRLTGLGKGEYRIYVDKVGFMSSEHLVTFKKEGERQDVNLELATQLATSIGEPKNGVTGVTTYPNPVANSVVSVRFTAFAGTAQLSLVDAMGKQVISRDIRTTQGENTVQLNVNSLPSGVYMVTITYGNSVVTAPVTVVR